MNKGTYEGTEEEIEFVKTANKKQDLHLWKIMKLDPSSCFAVHVVEHKFGAINGKQVKPKADVFFCKGLVSDEVLKKNNYYLDEHDINKYKLKPVPFSGVSVKRKDSERYQILKMNPSTFRKVFGSFDLGAGASIYCSDRVELEKNTSVLSGWGTNWTEFERYFSNIPNIDILKNANIDFNKSLEVARKIKEFSNKKIYDIITNNEGISKFIFQGIGNFEEPFTAHWFYEQGELKKAGFIPFVVTTGSGRSKGDFTIVIKPKL